jgi:hypothetical protein
VHVDLASRSAHHRKYGTTFADSWTTRDGTTFVAVGSVIGGGDRIAVSDLLRTGARAIVGSHAAFANAIAALDRVVRHHASERRDDELAAALVLLAFPAGDDAVQVVGAGNLHAFAIDALGVRHALHGREAALGTALAHHGDDALAAAVRLHRDDVVVASTAPVDDAWWPAGKRTAEALLQRSTDAEASVAVITG